MIDKELIHKAAEDIDIFEADLTEEYDRIAHPHRTIRLWKYAPAACLLFAIVGLSFHLLKDDSIQVKKSTATIEKSVVSKHIAEDKHLAQIVTHVKKKADEVVTQEHYEGNAEPIQNEKNDSVLKDEEAIEYDNIESNIPYAIPATLTAQDPALMNDYIAKLAQMYNGNKIEQEMDSVDTVSKRNTIYTFHYSKDYNIIGCILKAASTYCDSGEGFRLSFTDQRLSLELTDKIATKKYMWIAERIGAEVLVYCAKSATLGDIDLTPYYNFRISKERQHLHTTIKKNI